MRKLITIVLILSCCSLTAQESNEYKRQVSVDGTYLLSFLKTEEARITPFNIKFPINSKYNFRAGFNISTSTSSNKGFEGDLKIGIEIPHPYSEKWKYYYGADFNGAYSHHLWETCSMKWLQNISVKEIKSKDTTFNLIARKYL